MLFKEFVFQLRKQLGRVGRCPRKNPSQKWRALFGWYRKCSL